MADTRENKWTKDEIKENMLKNDEWMVRGLLAIYARQTEYERNIGATYEHNGVGFSGYDGEILSSFAEWFREHEFLTEKQMEIVRKKMPKYAGQLARIANGEVA